MLHACHGPAHVSIGQNDVGNSSQRSIGNPFGFSSFLMSEYILHRVKYNAIRTKRKRRITSELKKY